VDEVTEATDSNGVPSRSAEDLLHTLVTMNLELEAVGRRIGELRRSTGWRLVDLAEATGYTTSYLSQIERGVSIPSLTALATVALSLDVEMSVLLEDFVEPTVVITKADEGSVLTRSDGQWWRLIGRLGGNRSYTAMTQDIQHEPSLHRHYGERLIVVLSGSISLAIAGEVYELGPLDCIHYGAHEEHTIAASSPGDPEFMIMSIPAIL